MPEDRPTAAELVDAVTEFLEHDLQPTLEGRLGFHTRVAVNALRIVRREMDLGPELDSARRTGLRALLGAEGEETSGTRERELELARRIREGSLDARRAEVVGYLRATMRLQLDIVHPGYIRETGEENPGA
jgi:hypothetical protein